MPAKKKPLSVVYQVRFANNEIYLPVTMEQFEKLTNEILEAVNEFCAPNFLSADYFAQILMSAIHAIKHEIGHVKKSELFESCMNRISCHVTYHAVEEIKKRLKAAQASEPSTENTHPESNVVPLESDELQQTAH